MFKKSISSLFIVVLTFNLATHIKANIFQAWDQEVECSIENFQTGKFAIIKKSNNFPKLLNSLGISYIDLMFYEPNSDKNLSLIHKKSIFKMHNSPSYIKPFNYNNPQNIPINDGKAFLSISHKQVFPNKKLILTDSTGKYSISITNAIFLLIKNLKFSASERDFVLLEQLNLHFCGQNQEWYALDLLTNTIYIFSLIKYNEKELTGTLRIRAIQLNKAIFNNLHTVFPH